MRMILPSTLDWRRDAVIGANLRVPLYQGGGEYARVRQNKQTVRQRQDDLEAVFRAVRNEVTSAWQALVTATTRIDSIAAQVRANEIAVEGARQEALVGQRTTLDVLDQEQDLFQSQVDLVQARRDQIVASYRLKAAVGELTVVGHRPAGRALQSGSLLRGRAQPAGSASAAMSMAT